MSNTITATCHRTIFDKLIEDIAQGFGSPDYPPGVAARNLPLLPSDGSSVLRSRLAELAAPLFRTRQEPAVRGAHAGFFVSRIGQPAAVQRVPDRAANLLAEVEKASSKRSRRKPVDSTHIAGVRSKITRFEANQVAAGRILLPRCRDNQDPWLSASAPAQAGSGGPKRTL